jgi:hypothetical protein
MRLHTTRESETGMTRTLRLGDTIVVGAALAALVASPAAAVPPICTARAVDFRRRRGSNPHLNVTMRLAELPFETTAPAVLQGFPERMIGLEPTTFCMANAGSVRARSRPFAESP